MRAGIESELRAQSGREITIFYDRRDIAWGDTWKSRIDGVVDASAFLLPIITPSFLTSTECRRELELFAEYEQRHRRHNRILPIYYIAVPALEASGAATDALVELLKTRQYLDWRPLRYTNLNTVKARTAIGKLAGQFLTALASRQEETKPVHKEHHRAAQFSNENARFAAGVGDDAGASIHEDLLPTSRVLAPTSEPAELPEPRASTIDDWLAMCQRAGGLHVISGLPETGTAPSIALVCIPSFNDHRAPDDLRVRLLPEELFESVKRFPGFPNVMTMIGDGWVYWNAQIEALPQSGWVRDRVAGSIRVTVHRILSYALLYRLFLHHDLHDGARFIVLGLKNGGAVVLLDNPKVNAVYMIQKVSSDLELAEFRRVLDQHGIKPIEDTRQIVDFDLLYWLVKREFGAPN